MNHTQKSQPFFWGASTSAHQVEGGAHNNWSEWEKVNAKRLAQEARNKWTAETRAQFPEMFKPENYISGNAIEHYTRYESDFDLARDGGHNAHRFSIDWARIEPEEGKFDKYAIAHYVDVVRALRARNLEPFVTLWHWTHPVWLEDRDGVLAEDFAIKFARYAHIMIDAFADAGVDVRYVMTLNEPMSVISSQYITGAWPHAKKGIRATLAAYKHLADAHVRAYNAIKKDYPQVQVGFTEILMSLVPRHKTFVHNMLVKIVRYWSNERFVGMTRDHYDFLGVQYYFHNEIGCIGRSVPQGEYSDLGWLLHTEGLYRVIKEYARYGVPVYVTEDGLADARDEKRVQFLEEHIAMVMRARDEGIDVCGYFHWSLFDNFEWDKGYWPRFGLIEVDYETQMRTPRTSYTAYKEIIEKYQSR